jgi:hypothetical protein
VEGKYCTEGKGGRGNKEDEDNTATTYKKQKQKLAREGRATLLFSSVEKMKTEKNLPYECREMMKKKKKKKKKYF